MPSDFDQIAAMPPGGQDPIPELQNLHDALSKMRDFQSRAVVANQQNEQVLPPQSIQVNTAKGTVTMKDLPIATYEAFNRDRQQLNEIRGAFHQEAERLKAQEQAVRSQPPWVQLATALSANLAQAKDMPGWVQAAGRTAAQLNPRPEQIMAQRMGVMGEEAKLAEAGARMGEATIRTGIEQQRLGIETAREERLTKDEARKAEEDRVRDVRATRDKLLLAAGKGEAPSPDIVKQLFLEKKMSPKEADLLADAVNKTNIAAQAKITAERALTERRVTALEKGVTAKTSEKSEGEKALEAVAQSLAKGDLSAIRDVTSFRGQDRMKLYARAKEINPDFNTSELTRKINMYQAFTVGKDGQGIQSFDTFLQHAGEVTETLKQIELTNSPLLNKSLNWWRRNMKGTPELARLETSLEPVGKEFESFLLNQRALYSVDRQKVDALLNPNQPLKVTLATLGQMGKTAKDRFDAMNQRYKRVMKQDIEDPFSEEAKAAAAKIGIALPQGKKSTADDDPLGVR